jgi:hypothetical protein
MKAYRGEEVKLHLFLTWAPDESERSVSHLFPLHRKRTPLPVHSEARWAAELVWAFCKGEKSLALTGIRTTDHSVRCLVSIPTELSSLHFVLSIVMIFFNS